MENSTPHRPLEWRNHQPYSTQFEDIYFSTDNGLLESEYVFLQGNQLATRWQTLALPDFNIIETGFGTGLNFLNCAKLWLDTTNPPATLHFVSVEKYPLQLMDISKALALWPNLAELSHAFLAQYPTALLGNSITLFSGRIRLSLLIGDAITQLKTLNLKADAWFLDGFAPSKNPDMWHANLFEEMARLSQLDTTFATFTSAGDVRRKLLAAGFDVQKRTGFGRKREMLLGKFKGQRYETNSKVA
jgi:tRNA 5-methylaminomethyl-2-thiouridine biosynthesis bifunctional protein